MYDKLDRWTPAVLAGISLLSGIVASYLKITGNNGGVNAAIAFFIVSTTALASAVLLHLSQMRGYMKTIEPYISDKVPLDERKTLLRRAFQSAFFRDNSAICLPWWERFGSLVLNDKNLIRTVRPSEIFNAVESQEVRVPPKLSYALMSDLFRQVLETGGEYVGVATEAELLSAKGTAAETFLFNLPVKYPGRIKRLLVIKDVAVFAGKLDAGLRERFVEQLSWGSQPGNEPFLRRHRMNTEPDNFGVYGKIAVGELDDDGSNKLVFKVDAVTSRGKDFDVLFEGAEPLTVASLERP